MFIKKASSYNKHSIPEGIKTISFFYSFFVSRQNMFPARKSTYKHDKGGFGQMEVSYKTIAYFKLITRIYENIGVPA